MDKHHLVFIPFPFPGHTNPMLQLATSLHSKGFSNITIVHSELNFPDPSNHPHFNFLTISDGMSPDNISLDLGDISRKINNTKFTTQLQDFLSKLINESTELPCIIYDGFMYLAEAVARRLKVPSLVMRTSSVMDFLMYFSLPSLQQEGLIPLPDSKLLDMVPGLEPLRYKELPVKNSPYLDSLLQILATTCNLGSSSALIFNTIDLLENSSITKLQQICKVPVFALGPMHKITPTSSSGSLLKPDVSCIDWLDAQALSSVLYVSIGSGASMNQKEIDRCVKRLMVDKEGHEMRQRAMDLKEKISSCIETGGSSHNSLNELIELVMSL
ncbi:hypothetical protein ACFE04_002807 [Oxalis oulophora]